MENAHQLEQWRDLYVMLGTSSAALIGLLFVVMSLHLDGIMKNPVFYNRAHNITHHLLTTLVEAALILTPQPMTVLGAELVALNLFGLRLPLRFFMSPSTRTRHLESAAATRYIAGSSISVPICSGSREERASSRCRTGACIW
jgi:hypothetical protein